MTASLKAWRQGLSQFIKVIRYFQGFFNASRLFKAFVFKVMKVLKRHFSGFMWKFFDGFFEGLLWLLAYCQG